MKMSEIFFSIQGEGINIGVPSIFLRLSLCNLNPPCDFCDTKYAWKEEEIVSVQDVVRIIHNFDCRQLVVTGGEPMLQQKELIEVLEELLEFSPFYEFTVETNGTVTPEDRLLELVDIWMISPKSPFKVDEKFFSETTRGLYLKFVVDNEKDLEEIDKFISSPNVVAEEFFLMPQATTVKEHNEKLPFIVEHAKRYGYRVTPRLQILTWGNKRGT